MELGIDTASATVAIALFDGDRVVDERRWQLAATVSAELLAAIDALLVDTGVARAAISAIAVNVGPGGYGGLRSGVATAQGLALALGVPLAGVARLEADAYPHLLALPLGHPVVAVHDAGRAGVAWAAYALSAPGATPELAGPRIEVAAEAVLHAPPGATWCGELTEPLRAALAGREHLADADSVTATSEDPERRSGDTLSRSASDLVRLARLHDAYGDPASVDVLYLRPPSITLRAADPSRPVREG